MTGLLGGAVGGVSRPGAVPPPAPLAAGPPPGTAPGSARSRVRTPGRSHHRVGAGGYRPGMGDDGGPDEGLGLDEVLAALRHDLVAAREANDDAEGGYGLGVTEVEVELSVEVARSVSGEGSVGAKWFVVSGDASGQVSRDRTRAHRIRLTLRPVSSAEAGGDGSLAVVPGEADRCGDEEPGDSGEGGGGGIGRSPAAETIGARIAGGDGR